VAAQLVNDWARTQPVAIIQMLPQRLWTQTALKAARLVRVHAPYPGAPSGVLKKRALTRRSKRATLSDVAIPILTLEPEFVTLWSHLIAGKGSVWAPGVILSAQSLPLPTDEPQALSAQQRVDEFQSWASTTAFQLAILLAAAPLRLPIMRLVQKAFLPASKQVHLAEVFSSGLLQRDRQVEATSDPDSIHYDFLPDVRDALLSTGRLMDAVQVQRVVSEYIRERFGQVLDFQAVLLDPAWFDQTPLDPQIQPFAMVTADVLRRLGGAYAAAADRWQARVKCGEPVAAALGCAASDPINPIKGATQMVQIGEVDFPQKHPKAHEFYDGKHTGRREIDVSVTFDPPFTRQPKVVVSLQKIDLGDVAANIHRIAVRAEEVSLQGFNLYFETWEDSQIYDAIASWIAVGE
jgi:hypothetical protein